MQFSSNQTVASSPKNETSNVSPEKTKTSSASPSFGFNCSNLGTKQEQSECYNQFSKTLANQEAKATGPKPGFSSKGFMKGKKEASKPQIDSSPSGRLKNSKVARTIKKLSKKIATRLPLTTSDSSGFRSNSFVKNWAIAWEKQDVDYYLSFYSEKFKGEKKNRTAWEASRHRALKKNNNKQLFLSNIRVQKIDAKKIEINFTQEYKSEGHTDTGKKELLLENNGTSWKIIKETWSPGGEKSASQEKQINVKLAGWLNAWENQDVNSYLAFYSNKFGGPKGNRTEWKNARGYALRNGNNLAIEISNLKIDPKSNTKGDIT
jgi:murein L,D-transpeptidase YafK